MNTENTYIFPFGQTLKPVVQGDKSPKKTFVLGVYASAVHAKWIDTSGKQIVAALAVASEPEIFWTGKDAQAQIDKISIPKEVGKLVLPASNLNGPSGRALDELYLKPLELNRTNTWLSDIIPESRLNPNQINAINKFYKPLEEKYKLPKVTIPEFRKSELNSEKRREDIMEEILLSQAETIILLGDLPIKWFLNFYSNKKFDSLASFGATNETYGLKHELKLCGKLFNVIPLCHPRQAQKLGASSAMWYNLHTNWVNAKSNSNNI
jgi:uracil-DNA glycosylase